MTYQILEPGVDTIKGDEYASFPCPVNWFKATPGLPVYICKANDSSYYIYRRPITEEQPITATEAQAKQSCPHNAEALLHLKGGLLWCGSCGALYTPPISGEWKNPQP